IPSNRGRAASNGSREQSIGSKGTQVRSDVAGAGGVVKEYGVTARRVETAHRVGGKCFPTDGRIELAGYVVLERTNAVGRIFNAVGGVIEKRKSTRGRILGARCCD